MTSDTETTDTATPDPMTPGRLAEIREREQATIPGPWFVVDDQGGTLERWINSKNGTLQVCLGYLGNRTEAEAAFIAHARQDVPALLAEVERLRAELAAARKGKVESQLDRLDDWAGDLATVVAERDAGRTEAQEHAEEIADLKRTVSFTDEALREAREDRDDALREAERLRAKLDEIRAAAAGTDVDWLAEHVRRAVHYVLGQVEPRLDLKMMAQASEDVATHIKAESVPIVSERVIGLAIDYVKRAQAERDRLAERGERIKDITARMRSHSGLRSWADHIEATLDGTEAS
jgi:hypothetical protein